MKDNISPEEKLLRLIRGQKKQKVVPLQAGDIPAGLHEPLPAAALKRPLAKYGLPHFSLNKYFSLFYAKKALYLMFLLSAVFLLFVFIAPFLGLYKVRLPEFGPQDTAVAEAELKPSLKPYDFYSEGVSKRQIFVSPAVSSGTSGRAVNIESLLKDIALVGIISGDTPQAILEDKKTQKTYYLNKGQFMGDFQVEDIEEGKVTLNYKGKKLELYL